MISPDMLAVLEAQLQGLEANYEHFDNKLREAVEKEGKADSEHARKRWRDTQAGKSIIGMKTWRQRSGSGTFWSVRGRSCHRVSFSCLLRSHIQTLAAMIYVTKAKICL